MKKGKIILGAVALVSTAASILSFNAYSGARTTANLYTNSTCTNKIQCQTLNAGAGVCQVSISLYAIVQGGSCQLYTGAKWASVNL